MPFTDKSKNGLKKKPRGCDVYIVLGSGDGLRPYTGVALVDGGRIGVFRQEVDM